MKNTSVKTMMVNLKKNLSILTKIRRISSTMLLMKVSHESKNVEHEFQDDIRGSVKFSLVRILLRLILVMDILFAKQTFHGKFW